MKRSAIEAEFERRRIKFRTSPKASATGLRDTLTITGASVDLSGLSFTSWETSDNVIINGVSGADLLKGSSQNDLLNGGIGADTMNGGTGNDSFFVDNAGDTVAEAVNGGSDRVLTSVTYALAAGQEIEILATTNNAGTNAINVTGNNFAQTTQGNAGVNVLDGKGGPDTLTGGAGDVFGIGHTVSVANFKTFSHAENPGGFLADLTATLTAANLTAQGATLITLTSGPQAGAYVAINDIVAGFQAGSDAIVKVRPDAVITAASFTL